MLVDVDGNVRKECDGVKREKELSLVMEEVKKLTSDSSYSDLENAVKRGLKNIRVANYEERKKEKQKRQR